MVALQSHLRAHASPVFALPAMVADSPRIEWAGQLTSGPEVATTLPGGVLIPASSPSIGGPIRSRYTASLAGSPTISGFPCLAVNRTYLCKGEPRSVGSQTVLRIKTDAPVIELAGVVPDGASTTQTLIVDGKRTPPKTLSASRGTGGGWSFGTLRIEFSTRVVRDIWIETALRPAFIKIDAHDTLLASDEANEPQMTAVGDSYLQSRSTAFGNGGAIALEIAARLGIRKIATDAIGGTGYLNSGGDLGNLNDRLPAHSADDSILYLVQAGLNDYGDLVSPPQLEWPTRAAYEQAVLGYLQNLRLAQPKALIVVTAPFCPVASMSDSFYVAHLATNTSGLGDFLYKAQIYKSAIQQIAGPWVYVDVLMGSGWLNSSGASGDVTNLQWFTGGTPAPGTTATYKPGNTDGGGGGGFGGIARITIVNGGVYSQAPDITVSGGSGTGLLLASKIDGMGRMASIEIVQPGQGYSSGAGLPTISVDPTYETSPAVLGTPELLVGINPDGAYPLPSFAPAGATDLNNIYRLLMQDKTHPSPVGVEYLSTRLARNIYDAVMAL
jgi:hypothetical protein